VEQANDAFYRTFMVSPSEAEGRSIYELGNHHWNIPRLRELLEEILPRNNRFDGFLVTQDFAGLGQRTMLLNARTLQYGDVYGRILLGIQDVTELLVAQARYRALVEVSAQIVWSTDARGAMREDSPSWRAFTGQTFDEWQGLGWLDAAHPDDQTRVREEWLRSVAEVTPLDTEYRLRDASGKWRWMAVRAVPVFGAEGAVREWIGMNSDITDRVESAGRLREREQRFREMIDALPTAIYTTPNAVASLLQSAAVRARGPDAELRYRPLVRCLEAPSAGRDAVGTAASGAVALKEGRVVRGDEVIVERPDGTRAWCATYRHRCATTGRITGPSTCWWTAPLAGRRSRS
jgi:PAS domain S-box-containing protein